jgi:hypothetical protein
MRAKFEPRSPESRQPVDAPQREETDLQHPAKVEVPERSLKQIA